jgi:hypothetical protein
MAVKQIKAGVFATLLRNTSGLLACAAGEGEAFVFLLRLHAKQAFGFFLRSKKCEASKPKACVAKTKQGRHAALLARLAFVFLLRLPP